MPVHQQNPDDRRDGTEEHHARVDLRLSDLRQAQSAPDAQPRRPWPTPFTTPSTTYVSQSDQRASADAAEEAALSDDVLVQAVQVVLVVQDFRQRLQNARRIFAADPDRTW